MGLKLRKDKINMKPCISGIMAVTAVGVWQLACASTETDWSGKTGSVTIPAGETWVADEADMAKVNALTSLTVERTVSEDGATTNAATLIFRGTTTIPSADLLHGSGTVRKDGDTEWAAKVPQDNFTGDFRIGAGVVKSNRASALGAVKGEQLGGIWVESGASLVLNFAEKGSLGDRAIHLAGSGNAGVGAALKCVAGGGENYDGILKTIILEDDATLADDCNFTLYGSLRLDLNGHDLSYTGKDDWYQNSVTVCGKGTVRVKKGNVRLRNSTKWEAADGGAVSFEQGTSGVELQFHDGATKSRIERAITFNNSLTYLTVSRDKGLENLGTTNSYNFAGPVTIANGAELRVKPFDSMGKRLGQVTLSGPVDGVGKFSVAGKQDSPARGLACLAASNNTYTGGTVVKGMGNLGLLLYYPTSLPSLDNTTVDDGYLAARLGADSDGSERWTKNDIWRFMNADIYSNLAHFSLDATDCPNGAYALDPQEVADNVTDAGKRIIGVAGGTLNLVSNPSETKTVTLAADRGTLNLTGGGMFSLDGTNSFKGLANMYNGWSELATVCVKDGSTVVQGEAPVHVGGTAAVNTSWEFRNAARLVVTNANWLTTYDGAPESGGEPELGRGAIWIGHNNIGVLEVQDGAIVSNRLVVGGGQSTSQGLGAGAVYLSGGELYVVRKGKEHLSSSIGTAGYGYLEQTGGHLGSDQLNIANYGKGLAYVFGGTANIPSGPLSIGACNSGQGTVYMKGGKWNANVIRLSVYSTTARSELTVSDSAELWSNDNLYGFYETSNNSSGAVNLNHGGTLRIGRFYSWNAPDAYANKNAYLVNFNGGVLKDRGEGKTWEDKYLFGGVDNKRPCHVSVFEEGAVIDCDGEWVQHENTPLEANVAGGIQTITLPQKSYSGVIGPAQVTIANVDGGTGVGATAVCDWDPATRTVNGVTITSRGWGYEQGKVKVTLTFPNPYKGSNNDNVSTVTLTGDAITVGDNVIGGLTKRGKAKLTLNATANAWQKWTKVEGGTLAIGAAGAMPNGTAVTLSGGGTLDFGGQTVEVASVTYGIGGGTFANAENVTFANAKKVIEITMEDIMAGKAVPFDGTLDLSQVEIRVTGDVSKLDGKIRHRYSNFVCAESVTGQPTIVAPELPKYWAFVVSSRGVSLVYSCGLRIVIR